MPRVTLLFCRGLALCLGSGQQSDMGHVPAAVSSSSGLQSQFSQAWNDVLDAHETGERPRAFPGCDGATAISGRCHFAMLLASARRTQVTLTHHSGVDMFRNDSQIVESAATHVQLRLPLRCLLLASSLLCFFSFFSFLPPRPFSSFATVLSQHCHVPFSLLPSHSVLGSPHERTLEGSRHMFCSFRVT